MFAIITYSACFFIINDRNYYLMRMLNPSFVNSIIQKKNPAVFKPLDNKRQVHGLHTLASPYTNKGQAGPCQRPLVSVDN